MATEDFQALIARIGQLEDEVAALQARCRAVENATFWKISAPLRALLIRKQKLLALARRATGRSPIAVAGVTASTLALRAQASLTPEPTRASKYLFIELIWRKTASGEQIGVNDDGRRIAVGFQHLAIRSAETETAPPLAEIDFRLGGNAARHICFGMSHIEAWGAWSLDGQTALMVWLPEEAAGQITIEIQGVPFQQAFDSVAADVEINGVRIGECVFNGKAPARLSADLDALAVKSSSEALNVSLKAEARPDVSIVILNYNKPSITLAAVRAILSAKTEKSYEIIVADNGGTYENYMQLRDMDLPVHLLRLRSNRFFGEGNNLAAEHARAPVIIFLNNDAFVTDHAIDRLVDGLLRSPEIGATGPVFTYPDGRIQEAGAFLDAEAFAYQRGKREDRFDRSALPDYDVVDYVSAACVAVRREDFFALGGFDFRFEPAYYEDSDLCLRLSALGKRTELVSAATVVHVENATTSDPRNRGIANNVVERHRRIFLSRWGAWLAKRDKADLPRIDTLRTTHIRPNPASALLGAPVNCAFTPFPIVPGGGERYLLATASVLSQSAPTLVGTPEEYSTLRLRGVLQDLGLPDDGLTPEVDHRLSRQNIDTYVLMGNELAPTRPGFGQRRIYHCQFPFPQEQSAEDRQAHAVFLRNYETVVVNSEFTREAYLARSAEAGLARKPVVVIPPPVRLIPAPAEGAPPRENLIVSIGRFTPLGHAKRQDVIIEGFAKAKKAGLKNWRLVLCGQVPNEPQAVAYFNALRDACEEAGAEILLSPSRRQLEDLLWRAKAFVSATGFGVTEAKDHWRCEHFGISVVEAASAGCIPIVYERGGPVEISETLGSSFLFGSTADLAKRMIEVSKLNDEGLRRQLIERSETFSESAFRENWDKLLRT